MIGADKKIDVPFVQCLIENPASLPSENTECNSNGFCFNNI